MVIIATIIYMNRTNIIQTYDKFGKPWHEKRTRNLPSTRSLGARPL